MKTPRSPNFAKLVKDPKVSEPFWKPYINAYPIGYCTNADHLDETKRYFCENYNYRLSHPEIPCKSSYIDSYGSERELTCIPNPDNDKYPYLIREDSSWVCYHDEMSHSLNDQIYWDSTEEILKCDSGPLKGYIPRGYPDYKCEEVEDGRGTYPYTNEGYNACMDSLKPGGYYCNGPNSPGEIMNPFGEIDGVLNINTETGMKGATGCKWSENAYFDDYTPTEWEKDNITFADCNIKCSQQMQGKRHKSPLKDFSQTPMYFEKGYMCGWSPNAGQEGDPDRWLGKCIIKNGGQVKGNAPKGAFPHGRFLTKCNDIFENAKDVTPEVCGFKPCKGVAGPGYSNKYGGISGNCIETGENCQVKGCIPTMFTGCCEYCGGCGTTGDNCDYNAPCCGTSGVNDGTMGCGGGWMTAQCVDNNLYPCYWGGYTRDDQGLYHNAPKQIWIGSNKSIT